MIRYVVNFEPENPSVNAVECPDGKAPEDVPSNYIFDTEAEAWQRTAREFEAGLSLDTRQREEALARVRQIEQSIAETAAALVRTHKIMQKRGFRSW